MEKRMILEEIQDYNYVNSNTKLDELLSKLKKFQFDDFLYLEHPLNDKYFEVMGILDKLERELYSKENLNEDSKEYKEFKISVFKSCYPHFENGIKNVDLVSFLLFYKINSFLKIDIKQLIKNKSYTYKFNNLLKKLASEMGKMNILMMDLDSCINNKSSIKTLKLVFASKNLEKLSNTFKLINLENVIDLTSNSTLIISRLSLKLISFLKKYDYSLFIRTILELDEFLAIIMFVKVCTFEDIEYICKNNEIKNELLLFCFIKKISDGKYDIAKNYSYLIKNILIQIFYSKKELFNNLLTLFHNKELFNNVIGLFICDLSNGNIQSIIDQLPIELFSENNDYRRRILENCDKDSENYGFLLKQLYEKRRNYLKECLKSYDKPLFLDTTLTNLCICDLYYYLNFLNDNEIIIKITKTLNLIKFIDSEWFYSKTQYTNKFYIYYSDLLILSTTYHFKNLENDKIRNLFEEVMKNDFIKDLMREEEWDSIKTIEQNILQS